MTARDHELMGHALQEAAAALAVREMPIGCVFVDPSSGTVLARGQNRTNVDYNPTRHAEMVAIESFLAGGGDLADLRGTDLYVTIEPCIMCASALAAVGVRRAVFGPGNDKFGGCGSILSIHVGLHTPDGAHGRPSTEGARPPAGAPAAPPASATDGGGDADAAAALAAALAHVQAAAAQGEDAPPPSGAAGPEPRSPGPAALPHTCPCCGGSAGGGGAAAVGEQACAYHPYEVTRGVRSDEAIALLQRFYSRGNERAPQPRVRNAGGAAVGGAAVGDAAGALPAAGSTESRAREPDGEDDSGVPSLSAGAIDAAPSFVDRALRQNRVAVAVQASTAGGALSTG